MCGCCEDYGPNIKDIRRGGVEVDDFEKEVNYQTRMKGRGYKRKSYRRRSDWGCPGNDNGAHVYVWTSEKEITDIFFKHFGFHKRESKVCCGCGYVSKSRETEEYMKRKERAWRKRTGGEFDVKRGEPLSRFGRYRGERFWSFQWEMLDPVYKAKYETWHEEARRKWLQGYGSYPRY